MSDPQVWDDHRTIVALEHIVKKLVVENSNSSSDINGKFAEWLEWLQLQSDISTKFAFEGARNEEIKINAIGLASELDKFREEIAEDFEDQN